MSLTYRDSYTELIGPVYTSKFALEIGAPGPKVLKDVDEIIKISNLDHVSRPRHEEVLQYGCNTGNPDMKEELSKFLAKQYGEPVNKDDLFITTGSSQALTTLLHYYFNDGDTIFLENPTYSNVVLEIGSTFRMNAVSFDIDENGLVVNDLENYLKTFQGKPLSKRFPYKGVIYTIPKYHNPTGISLSKDRCEQLLKISREHDLLLICDDVYNVIKYPTLDRKQSDKCDESPSRLFYLDKKDDPNYKGNVVSIGSFSKILAPGLRLGWCELPVRIRNAVESSYVIQSGAGSNPYTSAIVSTALRNGLVDKHLQKYTLLFANTMSSSHRIITTELGDLGVSCVLPTGGYFLWVKLPKNSSAETLLKKCKENHISFLLGQSCSVKGNCEECLRISVAFYETDVLLPVISKFCEIAKLYLKNLI